MPTAKGIGMERKGEMGLGLICIRMPTYVSEPPHCGWGGAHLLGLYGVLHPLIHSDDALSRRARAGVQPGYALDPLRRQSGALNQAGMGLCYGYRDR